MKKFLARMLLPALLVALFLVACGGGSSDKASTQGNVYVAGDANIALAAAPAVASPFNTAALVVDSGPNRNSVNQLFTTITLCKPASLTQCQTLSHVLVDTGSTGLRILASVMSSSLQLSPVQGTGGTPVFGCANFLDGSYAWGPVALADIRIGGEVASNTPIQVVGKSAYNNLARPCSSSGTAIQSTNQLGATAILGVGLNKQDCGSACDPLTGNNPQNGIYFRCTDTSCSSVSGTTLGIAQQLQQPVAQFASDNNGLAVVLGNVASNGQVSQTGTLVFGLGTQANNQFGGLTTLLTDAYGNINTQVAGSGPLSALSLPTSFLDSGSNGLFFDSSITQCVGSNATFYCPASSISTTAVLQSGSATKSVAFTIGNADSLLSGTNAAVPALGGTVGDSTTFDWGLPLFYGRTVVIGIEGQASAFGTGPLYAL